MGAREFVEELARMHQEALAPLEGCAILESEAGGDFDIARLLTIALKNEIEATDLAGWWMTTTPEIDVRLGLARQAGDEAKHYGLIEARLRELGVDLSGFSPLTAGYSPLFEYLRGLTDTAERLAAGPFTREAIALRRNEQFIRFCEAGGDKETALLYRDTIQKDEEFHHLLGRRLLEKHAVTEEQQRRARAAAQRTLELAEELRGLAARKTGIAQVPGC